MAWTLLFTATLLLSSWVLLTTLRGLPHFHRLPAASERLVHNISVIVPACNEAATIENAVKSMIAGAALLAASKFRRSLLPAAFVHLGAILTSFIVFRSGFMGWRLDGIEWRGVRYSSKDINGGRRVFL